MFGLTYSETGIVFFIFLLVVGAAKLPRWGERIGGYIYRRFGHRHDTKSEADRPSER
jgi:Sec-independent protein translocase protein TatA